MGQYRNTKVYVVAWISWFDNELHQQQVEALHEYHALEVSKQPFFTIDDLHMITTMEELKHAAFDMDGMISVIEVNIEKSN